MDNLESEHFDNGNGLVVPLPDLNRPVTVDVVNGIVSAVRTDIDDLRNGTNKKRKGRGITTLDDIFSRTPDMPKIKITMNEFGRPVGENSRKLSSAIGCQLRKKLSVGCDDWRLVDPKKKLEVWTDIKKIYDLDDAAFKWFMATANIKWKEFKADLKEKYFDETLTDEELKKRNGDRILTVFIIGSHKRAKASRANLKQLHTSGSVSHACARHNLGVKLGRPPRRDEVFIKTHTRQNGVPLRHNELKGIVEACPELKDRTIQQGDAFSVVCGVKEPRGRVRVLGHGQTPTEIGTPGMKSYVPTRIQMEELARKNAESERSVLEQRIKELEEQVLEERMARERLNVEVSSQRGSNSWHQVSPRSEELVDEAHHNALGEDDCAENEGYDHFNDENLVNQMHAAAPSVPTINIIASPRNDGAPRYAHDELVGKEVVLFAMLRYDVPVAKGTIISTNPKTIVGHQLLGKEFCEVIVNVVMKRDAILPHPYDFMEPMAGAYMMSIAWPYKRLKVVNGASNSSQGAAVLVSIFPTLPDLLLQCQKLLTQVFFFLLSFGF
ncbi:hypothetical protein U9M48_036370 [Paspalum notatum var. saurae]|uniref:Transposase Tnp1/En/Spm-like domain-containing protein n=1 Tax=Paspalum notatum var. saurae TaxID=547442 RepID=A0AAQ3UH31_PASNO